MHLMTPIYRRSALDPKNDGPTQGSSSAFYPYIVLYVFHRPKHFTCWCLQPSLSEPLYLQLNSLKTGLT